ncbi:MAG: hypothetical protein ACK4UJ_12305 [Leptonema sp. (in: bacteria)]
MFSFVGLQLPRMIENLELPNDVTFEVKVLVVNSKYKIIRQ